MTHERKSPTSPSRSLPIRRLAVLPSSGTLAGEPRRTRITLQRAARALDLTVDLPLGLTQKSDETIGDEVETDRQRHGREDDRTKTDQEVLHR